MAITSFSNIFVQAYINYFGTAAMGGWTAYSKIDQLIFSPIQSIALASTTFVGQNLGKGDVPRAKKGINTALAMSCLVAVLLIIPLEIFAPQMVYIFNKDATVIEYGAAFLRWQMPFFIFFCFNQIYAGALRGSGNSTAPMIIMLVSFVGFRQLYLYIMANYISNTVIPIIMAYPAGWGICSLLMLIYYRSVKLERGRVTK